MSKPETKPYNERTGTRRVITWTRLLPSVREAVDALAAAQSIPASRAAMVELLVREALEARERQDARTAADARWAGRKS